MPVNRFPDFVAYIVQRLKVLCPSMGRAELHLGPATVGRFLKSPPQRRPKKKREPSIRRVRSKRPCHIWHCDLTTVPTSLVFWTSALPFALPQRWPFCWWVAVAVDHYSRRLMGTAVYRQQPSSAEVRTFLGRAMKTDKAIPKHLITDQGKQFIDEGFKAWSERNGIKQRFGAIGKYGSIAVIERLMRTIKSECTRKLLVSYRHHDIRRELGHFTKWYNQHKPRKKWPRGSPCASPRAGVKGRCGIQLEMKVRHMAGRKYLPIVELKKASWLSRKRELSVVSAGVFRLLDLVYSNATATAFISDYRPSHSFSVRIASVSGRNC